MTKNESLEMNKLLIEMAPVYFDLLSDLGKRMYMPKGIIFQSKQSKDHANKHNASIGIAVENLGFDGTHNINVENLGPMTLRILRSYFNNLELNEIFNYAPPAGDPEVRKFWQKKIVNQNPNLKNIDEISLPIVVGGLTHGLSIVSDLFINPNDDFVIADKMWENYTLMFQTRYLANLKTFSLFNRELTGIDINSFENTIKEIKKNKIVILLNFPNNPTGYTATDEEMNKMKDILLKYADMGKKILVICDDAYYGLFYYENIYKGSFFSKISGIHNNIVSVKIDGISKEDYAWGFRIGFVTFGDNYKNPEVYSTIEQKVTSCIRSSISSSSRMAQSILKKVMSSEEYAKEKKEKFEILKSREFKVKSVVYDEKYKNYWDVYPFNSGYFMCLRIKDLNSDAVRKHALFKYGLGTIAFGQDLRIAFSCIEEKNIEEVFEIIAKSIDDIRNGNIVSSPQ